MSRDRGTGSGRPTVGDEEMFKSPIPWSSQNSLINIDLTENKRARTDVDDSDSESGSSCLGKNKKIRKALERSLKAGNSEVEASDNEWTDVGAIKGNNNKRKKNNAEMLEAMNSLKVTLNKVRFAGKELTKYFADVPVNSRATGKMLAGNVERYALSAMEIHRKLELMREIEELRYRDSYTQVTPVKLVETHATKSTGNNKSSKNKVSNDKSKENLAVPGSSRTIKDSEEKWTRVDNKGKRELKKKNAESKKLEADRVKKTETEIRAKRIRENTAPKTDAVVIKAKEGQTYADILRNLKTKVGENLAGIQSVRRSRGGDAVLEIGKDADASKIEENIVSAFGNGDIIKKLTPKTSIEIGNIDPTVDKSEILG